MVGGDGRVLSVDHLVGGLASSASLVLQGFDSLLQSVVLFLQLPLL